MLKKFAMTVLILSGMAIAPAGASAADRDHDRGRDRDRDRREFRVREIRRDHFARRGYYDRLGCWRQ